MERPQNRGPQSGISEGIVQTLQPRRQLPHLSGNRGRRFQVATFAPHLVPNTIAKGVSSCSLVVERNVTCCR
jgi:hypothetical protein